MANCLDKMYIEKIKHILANMSDYSDDEVRMDCWYHRGYAYSESRSIRLKYYVWKLHKNALKKKIEVMRLRYEKCMMNRVFRNPLQNIQDKYVYIDRINKTMQMSITGKLQKDKTKMVELITKLDNLSPLKTLTRGYSLVEKENKIIKSVKDINIGDEVNIRLIDGNAKAKICD